MYFMSDPQTLHVTRNVIPGKLGVDLHLHRVHIPLVIVIFITVPETSGSHSAVFANLGYSVSKFRIGQHFNKNVSQNFTTSLIVFLRKWT